MFYDRKIRYLDYFEDGARVRGGGFVKLEARDSSLRMEVKVAGLHRNDSVACDVVLRGLKGEGIPGKIVITKGEGSFRLFCQNLKDIAGTGIGYEELRGIYISLGSGRVVSCDWPTQGMAEGAAKFEAGLGRKESYRQELDGDTNHGSEFQPREGTTNRRGEPESREEAGNRRRELEAREGTTNRRREPESREEARNRRRESEAREEAGNLWREPEAREEAGNRRRESEAREETGNLRRESEAREETRNRRRESEAREETGNLRRESEAREETWNRRKELEAREEARNRQRESETKEEAGNLWRESEAKEETGNRLGSKPESSEGSVNRWRESERGKNRPGDLVGLEKSASRPGDLEGLEKGISRPGDSEKSERSINRPENSVESERATGPSEKLMELERDVNRSAVSRETELKGDIRRQGELKAEENIRTREERAEEMPRQKRAAIPENMAEKRRGAGGDNRNASAAGQESGTKVRRMWEVAWEDSGNGVKKAAEASGKRTAGAGMPVKLLEDKWMQICAIYPHIHPFHDKREYISISPADFVLFSAASYKMVNNSFLLHGYYNYHHLILTRVEQKGECRYYVGVPGSYFEKEKQVAIMFGFESFECAEEPAQVGDFGYYMMRAEL